MKDVHATDIDTQTIAGFLKAVVTQIARVPAGKNMKASVFGSRVTLPIAACKIPPLQQQGNNRASDQAPERGADVEYLHS